MDTAPTPTTNVPEYTPSEISGAVKRTLEGAFGRVRIRGEITECKKYPSGHIYFALKDEGGKIKAIAWKTQVPRLGLAPENGLEVVATGRVTAYGDRSEYQLIVERLEYAGAGAILARIERLRLKLAEEGLFGDDRKRRLPLLPETVGVVTSEAGAVLHDIHTTIMRRFPRPITLWPVPVQGEAAAPRIAAAIAGFDALVAGGVIPRPCVLIIARGGGSLEDLMAFNDEAVLRAAAACRIPLISAVGHETDHTLIDLVSDRRAPTPTAAAELAVPSRTELVATVAQNTARLAAGLHRMTQERRLALGRAERGLPDLPSLLGNARHRLDDRALRLQLALPNLLLARRSALAQAERRIPDLPGLIAAARQHARGAATRLLLAAPNLVAIRRARAAAARLPGASALLAAPRTRTSLLAPALTHALGAAMAHARAAEARTFSRLSPAPLQSRLRERRTRLEAAAARLETVSHHAVLARGYAAVLDRAGHPVTRAAAIAPGDRLRLLFQDGEAGVTATPDQHSKRASPPSQPRLAL